MKLIFDFSNVHRVILALAIVLVSEQSVFLQSKLNTSLWHLAASSPKLSEVSNIFNAKEILVKAQQEYAVLDFNHILSRDEQVQLSELGIYTIEYLFENSYACRIDPENNNLLPVQFQVKYAELSAKSKLSESLYYGDFCNEHNSKYAEYMIHWWQDRQWEEIQNEFNLPSVNISEIHRDQHIVYLNVDPSALLKIAKLQCVKFIQCRQQNGEPEDREGRALHSVNQISLNYKENLFFDGAGVNVCIRDDGHVGPHVDFQGRKKDGTFANGSIQHGDMTSGICVGAGNIDPVIVGMAPGAFLYTLDYQQDFLDRTLSLHQKYDVMITNSSYSDGCNTGYTLVTQIVDQQLWENPNLMHVFSAGNANNSDCGYGAGNQWGNVTGGHKIAKNATTVANIRITGDVDPSSSRGPTKDGRMKPELSARGTDQLSTNQNNTYQVGGGTSAAAPSVAGTMALLYQAYKKLYGIVPEGALIKASLMNTAKDLGTAGPDYIHGYGIIDAYRAYKLLEEKRFSEHNAEHGKSKSISYTLDKKLEQLKIMIYWRESPSSPLSSRALINNIDLEVISPDGTTVLPLVLDHKPTIATLAAGAKPGVDSMNNFEQVVINNPLQGNYVIKINGTKLPDLNVKTYLLIETVEESLSLTYPIGKEQYNAPEITYIQFKSTKSDSVIINYSIDGGTNWRFLKKLNANAKVLQWSIPAGINSDSCIVQIIQGTEIKQSEMFTISSAVNGFKLKRFCPNEIELSWDRTAKDSFIIYGLGEKYMEPIAKTDQTSIVLNVNDPRKLKWVSIAGYRAGVLARRNKAIGIPDSLVSCPISADAGLVSRAGNNEVSLLSCGQVYYTPEVRIFNRTRNLIDSFSISYPSGTNIVTEKFVRQLKFNDTISVTLKEKALITQLGQIKFPVWVSVFNDGNPYNDTTFINLNLLSTPDPIGVYPMIEQFESAAFPVNWLSIDAVDDSPLSYVNVVNKDNSKSTALRISSRSDFYINYEYLLFSKTVDLSTAKEPYLYFDYVYQQFANTVNFSDTLSVNILSVCGGVIQNKLIYKQYGKQLSTQDTSYNPNWLPVKDSSWARMAFDLSEFKGQKIVVLFDLSRGLRHNLFLDNVKVTEREHELKRLDIQVNPTEACTSKNVYVKDSSDLTAKSYSWDFGVGALPRTSSGKGPFNIKYSQAGKRTIIVQIKTTDLTYFIQKDIQIYGQAISSFSVESIKNLTVQFRNYTINGKDYQWDFGDGTTSTERDPVHTFPESKLYKVKLTGYNNCNSSNFSKDVDLTSVGNQDTELDHQVSVYPNPSLHECTISSTDQLIQRLSLIDQKGLNLLRNEKVNAKIFNLNTSELTAGSYTIELILDNGRKVIKPLLIIK